MADRNWIGFATLLAAVWAAQAATISFPQGPAINTGIVALAGGAVNTSGMEGAATLAAVTNQSGTTSFFTDLIVGPTGAQVGSAGDVYNISGNFLNHSTQNTVFDLSQVLVDFTGTANHSLAWPGADQGPTAAGYIQNFSMGTLELSAGGMLTLSDGTSLVRPSAGLYVGTVLLDGQFTDSQTALAAFILANIVNSNSNQVLNIYYDPMKSQNLYLQSLTYSLGGGGFLEPIVTAPEPCEAGVLLVLAVCAWWRFRRRVFQ